MKKLSLSIGVFFIAALPARANTGAYAHCGTYDSYILLYKSTQKFEELGKLRCSEQVEVIAQADDYSQVQTADGRLGWVISSDLSSTAPPPQEIFTFGLTGKRESQAAAQPEVPKLQPVVARSAERTEPARLITNVNVMKMEGDHSSPEAIIAKINASHCDFDTSPAGIHRLKQAGVSDRIVLAMLHAPEAFPAESPDGSATIEVKIPDSTSMEVALSGDVSPDGLQEGSIIEMSVVQDVTLDGVTVIPSGAQARARVMATRRPGMGTAGYVIWFMQDIQAASGDRIPANFSAVQDAKFTTGNFAGYPYFISEYRKNSPAIAGSGDHFTAAVAGDAVVRVPQKPSAGQVAARAKMQPIPQAAPTENAPALFPVVVQTPERRTAVKP
jgi:hypothetical protein